MEDWTPRGFVQDGYPTFSWRRMFATNTGTRLELEVRPKNPYYDKPAGYDVSLIHHHGYSHRIDLFFTNDPARVHQVIDTLEALAMPWKKPP